MDLTVKVSQPEAPAATLAGRTVAGATPAPRLQPTVAPSWRDAAPRIDVSRDPVVSAFAGAMRVLSTIP